MFGFSRNPERHQKIGRAVRVVVGLILLSSAALKLDDLLYGEATALLWLPSPRWVFAAIEVEALVGLWLLSGWQARWAWGVAIALFVGLALVALNLALQGQNSCGCIGRISARTSPWLMVTFDLIVLAGLTIYRPLTDVTKPRVLAQRLVFPALITFGMLLVTASVLNWVGNHPSRFLARLRGESLLVDPYILDTGTGFPGEFRDFSIRLQIHGDVIIHVVGGTSTCACATTNALPVTIRPGGAEEIMLRVRFKGSEGRFHQRYILFCEWEGKVHRVSARFVGIVSHPIQVSVASVIENQMSPRRESVK